MAITNTTIDLEWTAATDNVGVVSYEIYQSEDNVTFSQIHQTDGVTLAYTATGLTPDTQYYFKQTAKDAAGNQSLYGNTVTATTLGGVVEIDWDYTKMYIGEGDNTNLVTLYFTGQNADITSVPAVTDWVLDPFNVVNTVTVYTDRVELLVNTAFDSSSSVTIDYTPGVNPLKDIDGILLTALNDQHLDNLLVPSFDVDYQAILDYATNQGYALPSSGQQTIQNQLVLDWKSNGIWDEEDVIYVLATDGDVGFASLNWKDPSLFQLTSVGGYTLTPNLGINSDGVLGTYINTNWNLATDGVKATETDASNSMYTFGYVPGTTYSIASCGTGSVNHASGVGLGISNRATGFNYYKVNSTSARSFSQRDLSGFLQIYNNATTNFLNQNNGEFTDSSGKTMSLVSMPKMALLAHNDDDNVFTSPCPPEIKMSFWSAGSAQEDKIAEKYNLMQQYMIDIGAIMSSSAVDNQLIQADNDGLSNDIIDLSVNAEPRTSASDTAVSNLISRNVTVITA